MSMSRMEYSSKREIICFEHKTFLHTFIILKQDGTFFENKAKVFQEANITTVTNIPNKSCNLLNEDKNLIDLSKKNYTKSTVDSFDFASFVNSML